MKKNLVAEVGFAFTLKYSEYSFIKSTIKNKQTNKKWNSIQQRKMHLRK